MQPPPDSSAGAREPPPVGFFNVDARVQLYNEPMDLAWHGHGGHEEEQPRPNTFDFWRGARGPDDPGREVCSVHD